MSQIEQLLGFLSRVRQTGRGRWIACCPAHDDVSPSMSLRETDDGVILLHCFAGCSAHEITAAIGLDMANLFPQRDEQHFHKGKHKAIPAADILLALRSELTVGYLILRQVRDGKPIQQKDLDRLLVAINRIEAGIKAGGLNV
jgi:hypothetical protein